HYHKMWKQAVIANWERWKDVPNSKTGQPRFQARFATAEEFWHWWLTHKHPDVLREDCQSGILWTNEDDSDIGEHSTPPPNQPPARRPEAEHGRRQQPKQEIKRN